MRVFERTVSPITADPNGIALAQTLAGGGAQDLTLIDPEAVLDPPRRVEIDSVGDDSGITFTVYGTDRANTPIEETVQGENADTAVTVKIFKTVTRIVASGDTADDVEAGWGTESVSSWIILGNFKGNYDARVVGVVPDGATVDYDIEVTSQNILRDRITGDEADDILQLTANDTDRYDTILTAPYAAARLVLNSGDAPVKLRVLPSRTV
jgi:hypothetical protein